MKMDISDLIYSIKMDLLLFGEGSTRSQLYRSAINRPERPEGHRAYKTTYYGRLRNDGDDARDIPENRLPQ